MGGRRSREQEWGPMKHWTSTAKGQATTLDTSTLSAPATWPTLSPQSFQSIAAEMACLRHCHQQKSWGAAPGTWRTCLVEAGE
eukprot:416177-Lingulodinium_polyedra.AAC.1